MFAHATETFTKLSCRERQKHCAIIHTHLKNIGDIHANPTKNHTACNRRIINGDATRGRRRNLWLFDKPAMAN